MEHSMDIDGDTSGSAAPSSSSSDGDFSDLVGASLTGEGGHTPGALVGAAESNASSSDLNAVGNADDAGIAHAQNNVPHLDAAEPDFSHLISAGSGDGHGLAGVGLHDAGGDDLVLGHHDLGGDALGGGGAYDGNVAHALDTVLHDAGSALDILTTSHDLFDVPVLDLGDVLPT
jgi:hypothetical protein